MENYHLSKHTASWKESMINRLSNLNNHNARQPKYHRFYALVYTRWYAAVRHCVIGSLLYIRGVASGPGGVGWVLIVARVNRRLGEGWLLFVLPAPCVASCINFLKPLTQTDNPMALINKPTKKRQLKNS